jgi:hypothetical protein
VEKEGNILRNSIPFDKKQPHGTMRFLHHVLFFFLLALQNVQANHDLVHSLQQLVGDAEERVAQWVEDASVRVGDIEDHVASFMDRLRNDPECPEPNYGPPEDPATCVEVYAPVVCGDRINGCEYSNGCFAGLAGYNVEDECVDKCLIRGSPRCRN